MSEIVNCFNCGKQNLWDKGLEERCVFCGLPLRRKVKEGATEEMVSPERLEIKVEPRKPGRPPGKRTRLHYPPGYLEAHKEEIIADHQTMRLVDFFRKWHLSSNTWTELKGKWGVTPKRKRTKAKLEQKEKRKYNRSEQFYQRYPHLRPGAETVASNADKVEEVKLKFESNDYFRGYRQAVLDGAPKIIMKEE